MVMLAYAISMVVGEVMRSVQYTRAAPNGLVLITIPEGEKRSRWYLFSGPILSLK